MPLRGICKEFIGVCVNLPSCRRPSRAIRVWDVVIRPVGFIAVDLLSPGYSTWLHAILEAKPQPGINCRILSRVSVVCRVGPIILRGWDDEGKVVRVCSLYETTCQSRRSGSKAKRQGRAKYHFRSIV